MTIFIWLTIVVLISSYICLPIFDPDLWWHITVGRWIYANGTVPVNEHWNLYAAGRPWTAYSWPAELIFSFADKFGISGLMTLQILMAVIVVATFFVVYSKIAHDWFIGGVLGVYVACGCIGFFAVRPQSLIWPIFCAVIYVSYQINKIGLTMQYKALLFILMLLWSNLHISQIFGIFAIVLITFDLKKIYSKTLPAIFTAFLGSICTPYLGYEWIIFFSKSAHPFIYSTILEFGPATILHYTTCLFILGIVLSLALLFELKRSKEFTQLIILAACSSIAGLAVVKFMPFALVCIAALLAAVLGEFKLQNTADHIQSNLFIGIKKLGSIYDKLQGNGFAFLLVAITWVTIHKLYDQPLWDSKIPIKAVDFIEKHNLPQPLMNALGEGGYLMYRFSDPVTGELTNKVTMDGRTNVNLPEVAMKSSRAYQGQNKWNEYLELVKPNTILWKSYSPLIQILGQDNEWCKVFSEFREDQDGYTVFTKREIAVEQDLKCF